MTKIFTHSLALAKKKFYLIVLLLAPLVLWSQNTPIELNNERIEIDVTSHPSIELTGEGSVELYSSSGEINLDFSLELAKGIKVYTRNNQTLNITDGGSIKGGVIYSDVVIKGEAAVSSDVNFPKNSITVQSGRLNIESGTVYAENISVSENATLDLKSSVVLAKNFNVSSEAEFISDGLSTLYANNSVNTGSFPIQLPSVGPVTCGTDVDEIPFTINSFVNTNYNGEDVSCNGADDGEACVDVVGGSGNFSYQWFGGNGNTDNTGQCYSNQGSATLLVLVTDLDQQITCVDNVEISEPSQMALFALNPGLPTCADICNGFAFPVVVGGMQPYNYSYDNGVNTQVASNLCAGANVLVITDLNGCMIDTLFNLEIEEIVSNVTFTDSICFGSSEGSAISAPSGGGGEPYTFDWSTGSSSNELVGLSAGSYDLTVFDSDGCSKDTTFTIEFYSEVEINIEEITEPVCEGDEDGSINISVSGGTEPYDVVWSDGINEISTQQDLFNLSAGTYNLSVLDANGCSAETSVTLESDENIIVEVNVSQPECFESGCQGQFEATIVEGDEPFFVEWINELGTFSNALNIENQCPGIYTLEVTDANGCFFTEQYEIILPEEITGAVDISDPSCFGFSDGSISVTLDNAAEPLTSNVSGDINGNVIVYSNLSSGNFNSVITDANGCTFSLNETLIEPEELFVSENITPLSCFEASDASISIEISGGEEPYSIFWVEPNITDQLEISGLSPGTYNLEVEDANSCVFNTSFEIEEVEEITLEADIENVLCNGESTGSIDLTVNNATDPYIVIWTNVANTSDEDQFNLEAGTYQVTVIDANNCEAQASFDISEEPEIEIAADIQLPDCSDDLGEISIEITGGTEPYTIEWSDPIYNGQTLLENLDIGFYDVTVTDANDCEVMLSSEITAPEPLEIAETLTQPGCTGALTGSISIALTGGTAPYSIIWSGGIAADDALEALDVLPGDYSVTVTDANDCENSLDFTIEEPGVLDVSCTVTNVLCNGESTGSIECVASGVEPYTVVWTSALVLDDNLNQFDLPAGDYTVDVTDAEGCEFTETFTISEGETIDITETLTQPGCTGALTGSISIALTGGTAPYSVIWSGGIAADDALEALDLLPGDYSVTVTDANDCENSLDFTIEEPGVLDVSCAVTNVLCNGESTGSIECVASGVEPYTVVWTSALVLDDNLNQFDLPAGDYTVDVTDAEGCEFIETFTISEELLLEITSDVEQPECSGDLGSIDITITGGTEPYTEVWDDAVFNGQTSLSDLGVGTYEVTVTDANGCEADTSIEIIEPESVEITETLTQPGCTGALTGSISIALTGGTAPYSVIWSGGIAADDALEALDLLPGDYSVTVTDANDCENSLDFTIEEPGVLDVSCTVTNVLCNGESTGSIECVASGVEPYTVVWTSALVLDDNLNQFDLPAGDYTVDVTDAEGCEFTETFTISEELLLEITSDVEQPECSGDLGSIDITITGGTEPYTVVWDDAVFNGQTSLSDLGVRTYDVTVTDANGCEADTSIEIIEPESIDITETLTQPGCTGALTGSISIALTGGTAPYSVIWSGGIAADDALEALDLLPGDYSVTVTDANDCENSLDFTIEEPGVLDVSCTVTNVLCNGESTGSIECVASGVEPYAVVWTSALVLDDNLNQFDLPAGDYTVDVTDAEGCEFTETFTISEELLLEITSDVEQPECSGDLGSIDITITGGTEPYTVVWDDAMFNGQTSLSDLGVGTYEVTVTDANGCEADTSIEIIEPESVEITETLTQPGCTGALTGSISIVLTGGTAPYSVIWSGGIAADDALEALDLLPGDYSVTVTDANDCENSLDFTIEEPGVLDVSCTVTNVLCNGESTGSIECVASGVEPYTVVWTSALVLDDNLNQFDLPAGDYTVDVTDAEGCEFTETFTISEELLLEITSDVEQPECSEELGSIEIEVTGGIEPYGIIWSNPEFNGQTNLENLEPGTYDATVTDGNGCQTTASFEITTPEALDVVETITQPICSGDLGEISVEVLGGTEPITIVWVGLNMDNATEITDLAPGSYQVDISDANDCSYTETYEIIEIDPIEANENITQPLCFSTIGAIEISPSGGTSLGGTYQIEWTGVDPANELLAENLIPGAYSVEITDDNGCSNSENFTIEEPYELEISGQVTNVFCAGGNTGEIDISLENTTGEVDYNWSNDAGYTSIIEDISSLEPGTYDVDVNDEIGCTVSSSFEVLELDGIEIQVDLIDNITCQDGSDGAIEITIIGGTPEYTYSWTGPSFSSEDEDVSGLSAGTYEITVSDINDCETSLEVTVEEGTSITAEFSTEESTCGNEDGTAEIVIMSENEIQTVVWSDSEGGFISDELIVNGLLAGNYTVEVTDVLGCMETFNTSISDINGPDITSDISNVSCLGEFDGSIELTVTGVESFDLEWTSGPEAIEPDNYNPTNLPAGIYGVQVTDGNGCVSSETLEITEPEELLISGSIVNVLCNGDSSGSIDLEITGGTEPYSIEWPDLGLMDEVSVSNLLAGDYLVNISDANGCEASASFTIIEEDVIELEFDFDSALCSTEDVTDIDLTVSGGSPGYQVSWTGDSESEFEDLLNVGIGSYTATVTDVLDCSVSETVEITQSPIIEITVDEINPSCGMNNGQLTAEASGGTGVNYSYAWYITSLDPPFLLTNGQTISAVSADEYLIVVEDEALCSAELVVNLSDNEGDLSSETTDVLCAGESTGEINLTIEGLADPITYAWSGPNDFDSEDEDLEDLFAGEYTIQAEDANGCTLIETIEIIEPDSITVDFETSNLCFGTTGTGVITAMISGGSEPYEISWTGNGVSSSEETISNLDEGCYTIEVTDSNDCVFSSEICLISLEEIVITGQVTNNLCWNDTDGSVEGTIAGGDPGYELEWTDELGDVISEEQNINTLMNGDYTLFVTDQSGCTESDTFTITSNPEITAETEITPIVCAEDDNACIEITSGGGVGNLILSWSSDLGFTSTENEICDLEPADYIYEITDGLGCTLEDTVTIVDPAPLLLNATAQDVLCFEQMNGSIDLNPSGGYEPYEFSWEYESQPFSVDQNINNLDTGSYTILLTDSMGCEISDVLELDQPTEIEVVFDNITGTTCSTSQDGAFDISVTGGNPDYTFSWMFGADEVSTEEDPLNLFSGEYSLTVTDNTNCELEVSSAFINPLGSVEISAPDDLSWCFTEQEQEITADLTNAVTVYWQNENQETISNTSEALYQNGPGVYELVFFGEDGPCVISDTTVVTIYELPYADAGEDQNQYFESEATIGGNPVTDLVNTVTWDNGELLNDSNAFNPTYIVVNSEQQFLLTVTSPEGCVSSDSMTVTLYPELDVHSGFTPNDDGKNDTWVLGNILNYPNTEVFIYNRWGEELFYSRGYNTPWDGTFNGEKLPIGTYYYVIVIDEPDLQQQLDGPLTILR